MKEFPEFFYTEKLGSSNLVDRLNLGISGPDYDFFLHCVFTAIL